MYPFERFSEIAKQTLTLTQREAEQARLGYVGTDHLVLALIAQPDSLAGEALLQLGVDFDQARVKIRGSWPRRSVAIQQTMTIPVSRVKWVIAFAFEDAAQSGSKHVDTAHLLVGVLTDGYGVASDTLVGLGATLEEVRSKIAAVISGAGPGEERD